MAVAELSDQTDPLWGVRSVRVRDVMNDRVIRVSPESKVCDALRVMLESQVDGVPVVNDRNEVVGIITYADLLRRGRRQHPRALDFFLWAVWLDAEEDDAMQGRMQRILDLPVSQVCTQDVLTCSPDDDVAEVAGLMVDYGVKRVPVVAESGALVGIVSRGDIMRAVWHAYERRE